MKGSTEMNFCNCPDCRTNDCPAAEELAAWQNAFERFGVDPETAGRKVAELEREVFRMGNAIATKPARIVLSRSKGWRMPENTVRVCRPTKYGNPHRVGFCPVCGVNHTQAEAVAEFRSMLELAEIPHDLSELRGKNLACWCKAGTPCHADVLLEMANSPIFYDNTNRSNNRASGR